MSAKSLSLSISSMASALLLMARGGNAHLTNPDGGPTKMNTYAKRFSMHMTALSLVAMLLAACSGGPMTTREKGAGIGALGGAAAGGIIGATVGHPGAGAAIGGALGLGAGALIGDYMQGQEETQYQQNQQQIQQNQREIERNRRETQRLRQDEY
jgi:phage tail tape-measure protein